MNNVVSIIVLAIAAAIVVSICEQPPTFPMDTAAEKIVWEPSSRYVQKANGYGCKDIHIVTRGETQWRMADRYAGVQDKHLWLRKMRHVNGLATDDPGLQPGQKLCIAW
jgi:hypothetical protein